MASISGYDSSSISTLFSSLNTGNRTSSGYGMNFGVNLSDYGLIKNGSYQKMMKAYYETDGAKKQGIASTATSKDGVKTLSAIESSASDLKESAAKLYTSGSKSPFRKTNMTSEDGTTTQGYDTEAIYKAVSAFVSDYNSVISSTGKSNTTSIANSAASMVNYTKVNEKMLSQIGITVDSSDYTMKLNEDTFKKADMNTVKSLFNGNGSFGYAVGVKASMIESYAKNESTKANTYSNKGSYTYNYSTGELYNTYT